MLNEKALEALKNNQRQLDMDGCEVGVSRQALDELIAAYEAVALPSSPVNELVEKGRVRVPEGQTPLNDALGHRLLDVFNEGMAARDSAAGSPYHGHSLEHCLHASGWVQRDLRIALDKAKIDASSLTALEAENARLREAAAIGLGALQNASRQLTEAHRVALGKNTWGDTAIRALESALAEEKRP